MKIHERGAGVQDPRLGGVGGTLEPGGTGATAPDGTTDGTDSVQLSDAARVLARLAGHVSTVVDGVGEVRQDRVQALRQSIETGQYRVDPDAVARGFLRDVVGQLVG
jgi:flagellar biosynthesis anti-sigma factor FlgM